jgi:hypothetical protein
MIARIVTRFAAGLRFPTLFGLVATLFAIDLVVPDLVPFMDEILLALATLLLGALRRRREVPSAREETAGVSAAGGTHGPAQPRADATARGRP